VSITRVDNDGRLEAVPVKVGNVVARTLMASMMRMADEHHAIRAA
jgi:hypothetical protein